MSCRRGAWGERTSKRRPGLRWTDDVEAARLAHSCLLRLAVGSITLGLAMMVDATQGDVVVIGTLDAQLTTSATFAMDDASCHASDFSLRLIARP